MKKLEFESFLLKYAKDICSKQPQYYAPVCSDKDKEEKRTFFLNLMYEAYFTNPNMFSSEIIAKKIAQDFMDYFELELATPLGDISTTKDAEGKVKEIIIHDKKAGEFDLKDATRKAVIKPGEISVDALYKDSVHQSKKATSYVDKNKQIIVTQCDAINHPIDNPEKTIEDIRSKNESRYLYNGLEVENNYISQYGNINKKMKRDINNPLIAQDDFGNKIIVGYQFNDVARYLDSNYTDYTQEELMNQAMETMPKEVQKFIELIMLNNNPNDDIKQSR